VTRVTKHGVVDVDGVEHEVDVLLLATGFQPANFLGTLDVCGRDGRSIHEVWGGEPQAFLGMTVPGFPNFYMLFGPNTNGIPSVIFYIECEVNYAVRTVKRMIRKGFTSVEVREDFTARYNQWIQSRLTKTVFQRTNNYYKSASGKIVTNLELGGSVYWLLSRLLRNASTVARKPAGPGEDAAQRRGYTGAFASARFTAAKGLALGLSWILTKATPSVGGGETWV
jgi:hypothetical protein